MSENRKECPTPETKIDRQLRAGEAMYRGGYIAKLECQLAEARENMKIERERADDAGKKWKQATEALAEVREQRDRLAEALDTITLIVGLTPIAGNKQALQEAMDAARSELAAVKGGKQ